MHIIAPSALLLLIFIVSYIASKDLRQDIKSIVNHVIRFQVISNGHRF